MDNIDVDKMVSEANKPKCEKTESELTENIIKSYKRLHGHLIKEILVEVPYNNYGDRGYVDLFIRWKHPRETETLIEVKSIHALENATGANEICRQLQSMSNNFFAGSDYTESDANYTLVFAPDYRCIKHIKTNFEMYKSATKNDSGVGIVATEDDCGVFLPVLKYGELVFPVSEYAEEISKRYPETKSKLHLPLESLHDWLLQDY